MSMATTKTPNTTQVSNRLPDNILALVDQYTADLKKRHPSFNRTDAIVDLLREGLIKKGYLEDETA